MWYRLRVICPRPPCNREKAIHKITGTSTALPLKNMIHFLNKGDVKALQAEKSAVAMKDIKWYSHNSTVGFLVAGIWNNRYYPMTSLVITANRSAAHDLLVTGDADGYLRLFRYPCLSPKAEYNEEKVYSLQIAAARFLFNDKNVVTVGGTDASLMLWDVVDD